MKQKIACLLVIVFSLGFVILNLKLSSALTISRVTSNPEIVKPGEGTIVDMVIENNLDDDVEGVVVSLELSGVPFAPHPSSNEYAVDEIRENRDERVRFELIADSDAKSGTYKIPVKIDYTYKGNRESKSGLISLIINAEPKIKVSDESEVMIKGRSNTLKIKIVNEGLGDAKLLNLMINPGSEIRVIGSNKAYVGNLDSDDFETVEFKVFVGQEVGPVIKIPVQVTYVDSTTETLTKNFDLLVKTYKLKEAQNLGLIKKSYVLTYIILIIILISLYVIYRKIKKIRKQRKTKKGEKGR